MSDELKPCPFCGGEARAFRCEESGTFDVQCQQCGAIPFIGSRTSERKTMADVISAWNARAERTCHAVLKSEPCYLPDDPPEFDEFYECSECGEVFPYGPEGYCPRCGAKVAAVGIMRLVTLYDEEGAEGIECSECGWSEIHGWDDPMPDHCPMCKRKVAV